ncbi:4-alpha-glucanotransferase [uncultured Roseobacter sp.]|uniref:4-alpha-glucanotransferase n=1 Tax=uncultured Roseobacter sp. TaxID=114847 RepID=UPI00261B598F|nr:4-alpha-glucanotransferase [uncultured Roseobacter sp.]
MNSDAELADLARLCGVFDSFRDLDGVTRPTAPETQRALLRANGLDVGTASEVRDTLTRLRAEARARIVPEDAVLDSGSPASLSCKGEVAWHVLREGSDDVLAEGTAQDRIDLPALPMGLHHLHARHGRSRAVCRVIVAPTRAPSLQDVAHVRTAWGAVAALYGLKSDRNGGLGDFADLARLAEIFGPLGAGFVGLNPVHALGWAAQDVISPYSPSHRGFLNTNHIALDEVAGAVPSGPSSTGDFIDYAAHARHHRTALHAAYDHFQSKATTSERASLKRFYETAGTALQDFARFECLSTEHGPDCRHWPGGVRTADRARALDLPDAAGFHIWLQWVADRQLEAAHARAHEGGLALGLYLDLAVGARLDGAEAWCASTAIAHGVSLGAPPDHLSPAGQNWQLAAYAPRALAEQDYAPLRQILRQAMRHCGLLRIDHALGLNRSYWIPEDGSPGGYIRQPFEALMAIIAIEAHRAGTLIVGEDLGLVPEGFRDTMAAKGFYGYTVLQYEKTAAGKFRDAKDLRPQSLACFATHDTPTVAGFWAGRDIDCWHKLGWIDANGRKRAQRQRDAEKADLLGVPTAEFAGRSATDLRDTVHRRLAHAPTALAAVQLDDLLDVEDAQNLPGTVDEHPNWRRRSPIALEDLATQPGVAQIAETMAAAGRSGPPTR